MKNNDKHEYGIMVIFYSPGIANVTSKWFFPCVDPLVPLLVLLPFKLLPTVSTVILADVEVMILYMAPQQISISEGNQTQLTLASLKNRMHCQQCFLARGTKTLEKKIKHV
ncbi:hypothetical protein E2C01_001850 [Portunus trituberculatus]|uniref:Uncharacterized protein n=1 Tax=Portunus trituberculatus TaxID=210409 RepID=A0A5B7CLF7_PORTR|nr:hypothetical protein [Portunus trituberculatus]